MRTLSIKIPNVSESLGNKLEWLIFGGTFWPDQPLAAERKLSEELGVSRTSLRNALNRLRETGLLTQEGKRYFTTNVVADLLVPGLEEIAANTPSDILDYWMLMFGEVVKLSHRKAQNSDCEAITKASNELIQAVADKDTQATVATFEHLCRLILNGCYNYFLSQTHFSLSLVMHSPLELAISKLLSDPEDRGDFVSEIDDLSSFIFDKKAFRELFEPTFQIRQGIKNSYATDRYVINADKLVDAVLRHPLSFEAVFELRLFTERQAAGQAADKCDETHRTRLTHHIKDMTDGIDHSPAKYGELDTAFHHLVAAATKNPVFAVVDAALAPLFTNTTSQWLQKHLEIRSDQSVIHRQHIRIFDAINAGSVDTATEAMDQHLSYVLINLRNLRDREQLQEISNARYLLG